MSTEKTTEIAQETKVQAPPTAQQQAVKHQDNSLSSSDFMILTAAIGLSLNLVAITAAISSSVALMIAIPYILGIAAMYCTMGSSASKEKTEASGKIRMFQPARRPYQHRPRRGTHNQFYR